MQQVQLIKVNLELDEFIFRNIESVEAGLTFPTMATPTFVAGSGRQKEDKRGTFLKLFTSTPGIVTQKI